MSDSKYNELSLWEESEKCLLCHEGPCTKACPYGVDVDGIIRSYRFGNKQGAINKIPDSFPCKECVGKECKSSCLKGKVNKPLAIDEIIMELGKSKKIFPPKVDLAIDFCGVPCENPFFLSSSVVGNNYEMVAKAFDMGWAGVAFKTIGTFVPKEVSPRFDVLTNNYAPFIGFKNIEQISDHSLVTNLSYLKDLKTNYPTKIIVASIMGQTEEEWTYLAKVVTEAGADIIECNFSCPHMAADGLGSDVGQNPELVAAFTKATRKGTHLPILAKMTPNIGNMEIPAMAAVKAGADGIAAINTIKSVLNVDTDTFVSGPNVKGKTSVGGYSGKAVKPIALHFIYSMRNCPSLAQTPISGMGGIETWQDALEFMALGCENIQVTTAVMQYGYRIIEDMIEGMELYLGMNSYRSMKEVVGRAIKKIVPADNLDRDHICYPKFDREKCIGCGRCYLSCYDGGHQALWRNENTGQPVMNGGKCVGCHLCLTVCPVKAISPGTRVYKNNKK